MGGGGGGGAISFIYLYHFIFGDFSMAVIYRYPSKCLSCGFPSFAQEFWHARCILLLPSSTRCSGLTKNTWNIIVDVARCIRLLRLSTIYNKVLVHKKHLEH